MESDLASLLSSLEHAMDIVYGRPSQAIIDRLSNGGNEDGMSHSRALSQLEEQLDEIAFADAKTAIEGLHAVVTRMVSRESPSPTMCDTGGATLTDDVELAACIPAFVRAAQLKGSRHLRVVAGSALHHLASRATAWDAAAVSALASLLRAAADEPVLASVGAAVCNLACESAHQAALAESGVLPRLVQLLQHESRRVQVRAPAPVLLYSSAAIQLSLAAPLAALLTALLAALLGGK